MPNYLPPSFSNKWLQTPSNILQNNWDCLSNPNARQQQQRKRERKKKKEYLQSCTMSYKLWVAQ